MNRYLLNVSYIGTQFSGLQKIIKKAEPYKFDASTIQGALEIALHKLQPLNQIQLIPSSRTDKGVHALNTTFHIDLLRQNGEPYNTTSITTALNKYFARKGLYVRVLQTQQVSNTFHCRFNAKSRTYLYRLGILRKEYFTYSNSHVYHIPVEEYGRCHFVCCSNFDIDKMRSASKLFAGLHDFKTFMYRCNQQPHKVTRRYLEIDVIDGQTSACLENIGQNNNMYGYYNVMCKSSGFLHNQVRRIVGTLVAVGEGKVNESEVKCMLQIPSHLSWIPRIVPAPSYGLYLKRVDY